MRTPAPSEILLLARLLTRIPPAGRFAEAMSLLYEADEADRQRRETGVSHARFGDGSLMARCSLLHPPAEPMADDCDFLQCVAIAANAMLAHSGR